VIDDWNICRKLGLVFEARVAGGSCSSAPRISTRVSPRGPPHASCAAACCRTWRAPLFGRRGARAGCGARDGRPSGISAIARIGVASAKADSSESGYEAELAVDGNPDSMWHTAWSGDKPGFPHELTITLEKETDIAGITLLPRQDGNRNGWIKQYEIYVTAKPGEWALPQPRARCHARSPPDRDIPQAGARIIDPAGRARGFDDQPFGSLAEFDIVPAAAKR